MLKLKKFCAGFLSVMTAFACLSGTAIAADEAEPAGYHFIAYFGADGIISDVKSIGGTLTEGEIETLAEAECPDGASEAKVFDWTADLEPKSAVLSYDMTEDNSNTVTIYHTNDMHGSLIDSSSAIGVDKIAALRNATDGAFLVDAGDATQGVAFASLSKGEDVITLMNAAGYKAMAAGNHEFDYGLEQLAKNRRAAEFPIISANTYYEGKPLFAGSYSGGETNGENVIIEENGIKVGLFALTTSDTSTSTNPNNIVGVEFKNEIETAKEQVAELDQMGADVIVAITHMGNLSGQAPITAVQLAEAMGGTELDAIIDGHSHMVENDTVNGIVIGQTGTADANVGKMEITVGADGEVKAEETTLSYYFFTNIDPDPAAKAVADELSKKNEGMLGQKIGETVGTLWGGSINQIAESRSNETNQGDLISDSMLYATKKNLTGEYKDAPVVAVENGGGFRTLIPAGDITLGSVINSLPFNNTVVYKAVTPSLIYQLIEQSAATVNSQDPETGMLDAGYSGSFLQIGGMRFEYDPNAESGSRVKAIYTDDGALLDRNDNTSVIILASNDYVFTNDLIKDIPKLGEAGDLAQAVIDYIGVLTENGTKALDIPVTQGRIKTVGAYAPKDYTAHIRAVTSDGAYVPEGTEVELYIDGVKNDGKLKVGADGLLEFTVGDGPHAVKLSESGAEGYVNNYSGAGIVEALGEWNGGYPKVAISN